MDKISPSPLVKPNTLSNLSKKIIIFLNTQFANFVAILFFIFTIWFSVYFYRSSSLHKNHKFNVFINLIASFGGIALAATLFFTVVYHKQDSNNQTFQNYFNMFSQLTHTLEIFIAHPEMNYYYNDLFGQSYKNKYIHFKRNRVLENQITTKILNNMSSYVDYLTIDSYSPDENLHIVEIRLKKLFSLFLQSEIFVENWNKYKKNLASPMLIEYIKTNFNK